MPRMTRRLRVAFRARPTVARSPGPAAFERADGVREALHCDSPPE